MSTEHSDVAIDQVTAGMTLAKQVLGESGEVLLEQGLVLTDILIRNLRHRGVRELAVHVHPTSHPVTQREALAEVLARVDVIFRKWPASDGDTDLHELVRSYRRSQYS